MVTHGCLKSAVTQSLPQEFVLANKKISKLHITGSVWRKATCNYPHNGWVNAESIMMTSVIISFYSCLQ